MMHSNSIATLQSSIHLKTCQEQEYETKFDIFKANFFPINKKINILSLGAESVGRFAVYENGDIFISKNFGDILDENNFETFKKAVLRQIKTKKPNVILTDLHPLYNSTVFGEELSKKLKIPRIEIQHHIAHIFSAVGDCMLNTKYSILNTFCGITSDGTGYGFDGNIWGGEIFKFLRKVPPDKGARGFKESSQSNMLLSQLEKQSDNEQDILSNINLNINRIGSLEEQTMIGGDLAVKEPARMLIAILAKITNKTQKTNSKTKKDFIYSYVKKYYSKNEFELLYNQLQQNFNCQKTTSTGRILDAVSVLLGFAGNERNFKHEATKLLEENSTLPYRNYELRIMNLAYRQAGYESRKILDTTYLFEYLIKNINKDKKRLAATAQEYLAKGFWKIIKVESRHCLDSTAETQVSDILNTKYCIPNTFLAGGLSNNRIISSYLENKGVYTSKKIPRGDEGIAFGQIVFYILA